MIPQTALQDLRAMLESWGIGPDDWYVTGEASVLLSGYPVDYRDTIIDVILCRDKWPWPRPEEIGNFIPDEGTDAHEAFEAYVTRHGFTPDIHPMPHVGISADDRFEHSYWFPNEQGVRVSSPWAQALHRKSIIEFYEQDTHHGLAVFDQKKFIRWKGFVMSIRDHAEQIGDRKTVQVVDEALPEVDRAIAFFDHRHVLTGEEGPLYGQGAFVGEIVLAPAQLCEDGADFRGKIAVLTHMLPSQVTLLRHAAGIVTDQGGTLSHAAIIAREYKIPTLIGTRRATALFHTGDRLILDTRQGVVSRGESV